MLYVASQPFEIEELRQLGASEYVVPATALWELDLLIHRTETRNKARAALNVLERFVERGAALSGVTCGNGSLLRIARYDEREQAAGIDLNLADDQILATCLHLMHHYEPVVLVTIEFALHVKAITLGIESIYLKAYADTPVEPSRRDRATFQLAWSRLERADNPRAACSRALWFLQSQLVSRLLEPVRESGQPPEIAAALQGFDALRAAWTTDLFAVIEATLGLRAPAHPNLAIQQIVVPGRPLTYPNPPTWAEQQPTRRPETPDEHAARIRSEERQYERQCEFIVESVLIRMEAIREFILDQLSDELVS